MDIAGNFWDANRTAITRYLIAFLIVAAALVGYFVIEQEFKYLYLVFVPVLFVITISNARLAVYQYLFILFTNIAISESPAVLLVDISAILVVCAAVLDFLLKGSRVGRFPVLSVNFALLLIAIPLVALGSNQPLLAVNPVLRIGLMASTFVSLYRLSRYFSLLNLLKLFFWSSVIHSILALAISLQSGELERVFGLAPKTLDDLTMIALPVGLALYLFSGKGKGVAILVGCVILLGTLLATQSRLPIMLACAFSGLVVILSLRRHEGIRSADRIGHNGIRKRRTKMLIGLTVGLSILVVITNTELIGAVLGRFKELLTQSPGGSFRLRLILWHAGLNAFWDHPLLGIGPGNFRYIQNFYPSLHFHPDQLRIEGLSAHNLMIHYLAETGLVGASALVALLVNQYRKARTFYKLNIGGEQPVTAVILYVSAAMFLVTSFVEAGWMWGQMSLVLAFFLALIARAYNSAVSGN